MVPATRKRLRPKCSSAPASGWGNGSKKLMASKKKIKYCSSATATGRSNNQAAKQSSTQTAKQQHSAVCRVRKHADGPSRVFGCCSRMINRSEVEPRAVGGVWGVFRGERVYMILMNFRGNDAKMKMKMLSMKR